MSPRAAKPTPEPKTYLTGPNERGNWSIINCALPLCDYVPVESCRRVAAQFKLPWPLPVFWDGKFYEPNAECPCCEGEGGFEDGMCVVCGATGKLPPHGEES